MALFNDGPASSIEDLQGHDTQLLDVANTENIDVTRKLALAQEELSLELTTMLARLNRPEAIGMTPGGPGVDHVVVTPALKLWHAFRTLELVYRDAYYSQLNERYQGKRDEYHELAKWAFDKLIQAGIGMACDPIAQADGPALLEAPGMLADGTYYVAAAWTNATGEEGSSSRLGAITTSGSTFLARPAAAPANARGWNLYAGMTPRTMVLQNASPLRLTETWTQPDSLVTTGRLAGAGQLPNYTRPTLRVLQRG
jgi:hypothetical protein